MAYEGPTPHTGQTGGTGVDNGTKTVTLGGNLTTSGAFNSTFTMTGPTNVTFPTTGTLSTSSGLPTTGGTMTGDIIMNSSSVGITYAAAGGTGTATNDTLTAYEEGTFTPTVSGSTTSGTQTYTTQLGRYTRIGRLVYIQIEIVLASATGTGNILINGLPFTVNATFDANPLTIYSSNLIIASGPYPMASCTKSTTTVQLSGLSTATGTQTNSSLAVNTTLFIVLSGAYTI